MNNDMPIVNHDIVINDSEVVDKFEIINNDISYDQRIGYFYDMITFNFLRLSELHELLFCYYFLFYSYSFTKLKRNNIYKSNINDLENQ